MSCLKERALKVCRGGEALDKEFGKLVRVFTKNCYPVSKVKRILRSRKPFKKRVLDNQDAVKLSLPFIPEVSDRIASVARRLGMAVRYSKGKSIGSLLVNSKLDKVPVLDQGSVVYKQSCEDCGKVYSTSVRQVGRQWLGRRSTTEISGIWT